VTRKIETASHISLPWLRPPDTIHHNDQSAKIYKTKAWGLAHSAFHGHILASFLFVGCSYIDQVG